MNIKLSVLTEAVECFEMTRRAAARGEALSAGDYARCLSACVELKVEVQEIVKEVSVKVTA